MPRPPARRSPAPVRKAGAPPLVVVRSVSPGAPPIVTAAPAQAAPGVPRATARLSPAGALPLARIPSEALRAPPGRRIFGIGIGLWMAAGVSLAIHAVVLAIHFAPRVVRDLGRTAPIEVALVNARTVAKPTKADVLAQANLDGGGNTDQPRRAKSPLPVLPKDVTSNEVAHTAQKLEALERQTREVMTQISAAVVAPAAAPPAPEAGETPQLPDASELMQRTLEAMRLEAQIAKDLEAYQKRPKRRFVGARAEEYRFARYIEDWRLKIERIGNLNYPEAARREKLYGSLLVTVSINADGTLESIEVNRSSGQRVLDAAAVKIVEMAAPFAPFPADIKRDTDILHITRTWSFTRADEFQGDR